MKYETSVDINPISGMVCVSAMIGGFLVSRQFVGYTKREAIAEFRRQVARDNAAR